MIYLFFSAILLGICGYLMSPVLSIMFIIIFFLSLLLRIETNFDELNKSKYIKNIKNELFIFKFSVAFVFIGILYKIVINN